MINITNIDPKIWIAIAAVTAALITAVISLINMVISKDQKTTEFRQEWINSVRIELSNLLSEVDARHSKSLFAEYYSKEGEKEKFIDEISGIALNNTVRINNISTKLSLFLNPIEHEKLLYLISELTSTPTPHSSKDEDEDDHGQTLIERTKFVLQESQKVLKKEWEIVKRGEKTFYITKNILFSIMVLILIVLLIIGATINLPVPNNLPVP